MAKSKKAAEGDDAARTPGSPESPAAAEPREAWAARVRERYGKVLAGYIAGRGIEVPVGWRSLVEDGLAQFELVSRRFELDATVALVKEKFGTLRFHWDEGIADPGAGDTAIALAVMNAVVSDLQSRALGTCEVCGADGAIERTSPFVAKSPRCDRCSVARPSGSSS
ncbi:MAG: hypothetical protein KC613_11150 [Myxococcales bacterium]|nr:hypothetical protein [Myxococcales bacterium]